ncbi:hypothetical protein [Indioceanicola profundi]|uniref:hypothetical protein n=1 Tax=Indioceanicola profundi TaxID=2220096 RepID=UPI0013C48F89|nr:hypothetical protein [Indioceanicola profundi]
MSMDQRGPNSDDPGSMATMVGMEKVGGTAKETGARLMIGQDALATIRTIAGRPHRRISLGNGQSGRHNLGPAAAIPEGGQAAERPGRNKV